MTHQKKTVVIGITGGVAAYKTVKLIKRFRKEGIMVIPIITKSATNLLDVRDIEKAAGRNAFIELFPKGFSYLSILSLRKVDHIQVADAADLVIVAPATANIISKIAHGIADDFLTTVLLATRAPILLCPSMNSNMWNNSIVQENVGKIKNMGVNVLEPASGMLACGYEGKGRLPEVATIFSESLFFLNRTDELRGKIVLVTAGGTIEPIDNVRSISNRSSGKMGVALADACARRGASVILLKAKNAVFPRFPMTVYEFETTTELETLLNKEAKKCDICFHAAAVSDFTIPFASGKLSSAQQLSLHLIPRKKIYLNLKKKNSNLLLFLFKAEWRKSNKTMIQRARNIIKSAEIDGIIVNDVGKPDRGFAVDTNEVIVVLPDGNAHRLSLATKLEIADKIIDIVLIKRSYT